MKKIIILTSLILTGFVLLAQDSTAKKKTTRDIRREERRKRTNSLIRQEEEGVLSYHKQSTFEIQLRTNGYGIFYELGRMKSPRFTTIYTAELTEIVHPKEEKINTAQGFFLGNSFKYGKINNFYQFKLGFGQQYIFGQKGNKNGVAVIGSYLGGLSLGLEKPYMLQVRHDGVDREIGYSTEDSALFLSKENIIGGAGFTKGWSEVKIRPGAYAKTSLRFDFGTYNESISALEIGMSLEAYAKKVELLLFNEPRQLYYQAHIALIFGSRR